MSNWDIPTDFPYPHIFSDFASVGVLLSQSHFLIFRQSLEEGRCRLEAAPAIPDRGRGHRGTRGDIPDQGKQQEASISPKLLNNAQILCI